MLENRERLRLSDLAIGYLRALKSRFEATHRLMSPLPSTLSGLVRVIHQHATPTQQQAELRRYLNQRRARIQEQARRVRIDTFLLNTFESELRLLHGAH